MSTILPFVFVCAIPIAAGVIWLVMRSVMRNELRASSQLIERRREEWRAGGAWGRSRASIGAPSAATGKAGPQAEALAWAEEAAEAEEAAAAEATERAGAAWGELPALRHRTHRCAIGPSRTLHGGGPNPGGC